MAIDRQVSWKDCLITPNPIKYNLQVKEIEHEMFQFQEVKAPSLLQFPIAHK